MTDWRPNLLVIGAARASTTAVCAALGQHPDVFITQPKEPHFFAFAGAAPRFTGPGDEQQMNRAVVAKADDYRALYADRGNERRWGDGSVSTLYYAAPAIDNIRTFAAPDVKLVCLLREPAARSLSAFQFLRSRGLEHVSDFDEALALEEARIAEGYHHMWHYRRMSQYANQVESFAAAFPGQLFIGIAEEIRDDPATFSAQLCEFLEISSTRSLDLRREINGGGVPRSRVLAGAIGVLWRSPAAGRVATALVPRRVRAAVTRANSRQDDRAVDRARVLRPAFAPDVAAVEHILGRRIDAWHRT